MVRDDMQAPTPFIKRNGKIPEKSTIRHRPVESNAGSEQNAPSHDCGTSGEVAERLNALVLKTSKG